MKDADRVHYSGQGGVVSGVEKHFSPTSSHHHVLLLGGRVSQGPCLGQHVFKEKVKQWPTSKTFHFVRESAPRVDLKNVERLVKIFK